MSDTNHPAPVAESVPLTDEVARGLQFLHDNVPSPFGQGDDVVRHVNAAMAWLRSVLETRNAEVAAVSRRREFPIGYQPNANPHKCNPTLTECPRCHNDRSKCDGFYTAPVAAPLERLKALTGKLGDGNYLITIRDGGVVQIQAGPPPTEIKPLPAAAPVAAPQEPRETVAYWKANYQHSRNALESLIDDLESVDLPADLGGRISKARTLLKCGAVPLSQEPQSRDTSPETNALRDLVAVIDSAGLLNLSRGVELGPTVWYVKANDAMDRARALLVSGDWPSEEQP